MCVPFYRVDRAGTHCREQSSGRINGFNCWISEVYGDCNISRFWLPPHAPSVRVCKAHHSRDLPCRVPVTSLTALTLFKPKKSRSDLPAKHISITTIIVTIRCEHTLWELRCSNNVTVVFNTSRFHQQLTSFWCKEKKIDLFYSKSLQLIAQSLLDWTNPECYAVYRLLNHLNIVSSESWKWVEKGSKWSLYICGHGDLWECHNLIICCCWSKHRSHGASLRAMPWWTTIRRAAPQRREVAAFLRCLPWS